MNECMRECARECVNARTRERANDGIRASESSASRRLPPRVDRSIARSIASIASIASHSTVARSTHGRARSRLSTPRRAIATRDVAPRDARALARRFGARAERRSTARAGDDARDDGEARVARRATGTRDRDAAETTGGDPGGRARDAGAEDREARTTGDGWAGVRDVRGGEDVEMAKDG
jgi:hypothetical protein